MIEELQKTLKSRWETFTPSEQKIATYLLQNIGGIAFETAASLARHIGVSPMTVGRFLRNLGYEGLSELKDDLRGEAPWLPLYKTPDHLADASLSEGLQAEIRDLTNAHALAHTPEWAAIVDLLVKAERVSVASFHHGRFLGLGFANLLQHVRPRTRFVEGSDGAYIDMLLDAKPGDCLVLIDFRRYYRHFRLLAEEAAARGIPLVIITDTQCYWARKLTDHVLMIPIDESRAWHNFGPAMSLLSLLIGATAGAVRHVRAHRPDHAPAPELRRLSGGADARRPAARQIRGRKQERGEQASIQTILTVRRAVHRKTRRGD